MSDIKRTRRAKRTLFKRREFLTDSNQADSFIRGTVMIEHEHVVRDGRERDEVDVTATLKLTDCNRSVEWGFDVGQYTRTTPRMIRRKLANMRRILDGFERALNEALVYYDKHNENRWKNVRSRRTPK